MLFVNEIAKNEDCFFFVKGSPLQFYKVLDYVILNVEGQHRPDLQIQVWNYRCFLFKYDFNIKSTLVHIWFDTRMHAYYINHGAYYILKYNGRTLNSLDKLKKKGWQPHNTSWVIVKVSMDLNIKFSADKYQKTNVHLHAANFGLPCCQLVKLRTKLELTKNVKLVAWFGKSHWLFEFPNLNFVLGLIVNPYTYHSLATVE